MTTPRPDAVVHSAQGRDFSSFNKPVTAASLQGLSFAWTRVSDWSGEQMGTDPDFAGNWRQIRDAGLHRGAYWYLLPQADPAAQARYFVQAVAACGLGPGDMLVCDSEIPAANADEATRAFCEEAGRLAGPGVIVIVYADHDTGQHLASCTRWPLWFAWPSLTAPPPDLIAPWKHWQFWQWGQRGGTDADAFNGTAADLDRWIARRVPRPVTGYVTTGRESLVQVAAASVPVSHPATILRLTEDHDGLFVPHLAGYINAGNLTAPMPRGIMLQVPGTVTAPAGGGRARRAAAAVKGRVAAAAAAGKAAAGAEPALSSAAAAGILAAAAGLWQHALGLHLTAAQAGAVITALPALAGLVTAVTTRPPRIGVITGALGAAATAAAAFGLHLPPAFLGAQMPLAALVAGLLVRGQVTPRRPPGTGG